MRSSTTRHEHAVVVAHRQLVGHVHRVGHDKQATMATERIRDEGRGAADIQEQ